MAASSSSSGGKRTEVLTIPREAFELKRLGDMVYMDVECPACGRTSSYYRVKWWKRFIARECNNFACRAALVLLLNQ